METYKHELQRIKGFLAENPRGLTLTEISKKLKINRNSVAKYLDVLWIGGSVEMHRVGPAKVFFLSHRVPLNALINFSSEYILLLDEQLRVSNANENVVRLLSVSMEDLIGQSFTRQASLKELLPDIKQALHGEDARKELRFTSGQTFTARILPAVFEDGSKGVTIIMEDNTKEKEAEERLRESEQKWRTVINDISDGFFMTDNEGVITFANPALLTIFGCKKEEMVGNHFTQFLPEAVRERLLAKFKRAVEKGKFSDLLEFNVLKKDREPITIQLRSTSVTEEGKVVGTKGIIRDVTKKEVLKK